MPPGADPEAAADGPNGGDDGPGNDGGGPNNGGNGGGGGGSNKGGGDESNDGGGDEPNDGNGGGGGDPFDNPDDSGESTDVIVGDEEDSDGHVEHDPAPADPEVTLVPDLLFSIIGCVGCFSSLNRDFREFPE